MFPFHSVQLPERFTALPRSSGKTPAQLKRFRWRLKDSSKFDEYHTPLVWTLSAHVKGVLEPGHSFEHPIEAHELGKPVAERIISVEHNRQPKPEEKRMPVKF